MVVHCVPTKNILISLFYIHAAVYRCCVVLSVGQHKCMVHLIHTQTYIKM